MTSTLIAPVEILPPVGATFQDFEREIRTDEILDTDPRSQKKESAEGLLPVSFELIAPAYHVVEGSEKSSVDDRSEQFTYATQLIFEQLNPRFVSVADMPGSHYQSAYSKPSEAHYMGYHKLREKVLRDADRAGADNSRLMPIVVNHHNEDIIRLIESGFDYESKGIQQIIVQPAHSLLREGRVEAPQRPLSQAVQLLRYEAGLKEVGALVPASNYDRPYYDYEEIARAIEPADFAVTDPLMTEAGYVMLREAMDRRLVETPIVPGLPILRNVEDMPQYYARYHGCAVDDIYNSIKALPTSDERREACRDLIVSLAHRFVQLGAPGLHFYTNNNVRATQRILDRLQDVVSQSHD